MLLEAEPFTEANGMLTPTQKLKRHAVLGEYKSVLEGLCAKLDAEVRFVEIVDEVLARPSSTDDGDQKTTDSNHQASGALQSGMIRRKNFFEIGGDSLSGTCLTLERREFFPY